MLAIEVLMHTTPQRSAREERSLAKRGRPKGSVSLNKQMAESILQFIRAGGFDHVAAEAAGISDRTFRDWMARGEGRHPTRSSSGSGPATSRSIPGTGADTPRA